jgi:hypothetical protein
MLDAAVKAAKLDVLLAVGKFTRLAADQAAIDGELRGSLKSQSNQIFG